MQNSPKQRNLELLRHLNICSPITRFHMKKPTLLLLLLLHAVAVFAQIQWEHTYPKGQVWRTRLDVSGETYAHGHALTCNVTLYDATHAQKADLPVNAGSECNGYLFSEKIMDDDGGVELLFNWLDANLQLAAGTTFRDDNGAQTELGHRDLQLSRPSGLPAKLLSGAIVRNLPGLQIEHTYGNTNWRLQRQIFPLDGERYIAHDFKDFDGFHFHDAQHNWIKTVRLDRLGFDYMTHISQQYFNADPKLEFSGTRWTGGTDPNGNRQATEVVQEDGTVLFSMACENAALSQINGLTDRMLVYGYGSPQQWQTTVIDPATFAVLHTFPGSVSRMIMPDGEEIYWQYIYGEKVLIYNAQFQLLKTVALPNSFSLSITRGQFSKGNKFEFCYNLKGANQPKWVRCSDEDGNVLYEFPGAIYAKIDRQEGMADRLFVPYGTLADSTQVYKFVKSNAVSPLNVAALASAQPNPFEHTLQVRFAKPGDYRLTLVNAVGQALLQHTAQGSDQVLLATENLPAGMYWLQIEGKERQILKVVKK